MTRLASSSSSLLRRVSVGGTTTTARRSQSNSTAALVAVLPGPLTTLRYRTNNTPPRAPSTPIAPQTRTSIRTTHASTAYPQKGAVASASTSPTFVLLPPAEPPIPLAHPRSRTSSPIIELFAQLRSTQNQTGRSESDVKHCSGKDTAASAHGETLGTSSTDTVADKRSKETSEHSPLTMLPKANLAKPKSKPAPAVPQNTYLWTNYTSSLPGISASDNFDGNNNSSNVLYLRDHLTADRVLAELHASLLRPAPANIDNIANDIDPAQPVLGFDLEWRPRFASISVKEKRSNVPRENPVALVQLASRERVWLIQVCAMGHFPKRLVQILEDEEIIKCGVSILSDAQKLYREQGVQMRRCVELSYLARTVDPVAWPPPPPQTKPGDPGKESSKAGQDQDAAEFQEPSVHEDGNEIQTEGPHKLGKKSRGPQKMALISLARLVAHYTGEVLPKGRVQRSNWEAQLSVLQQTYAANDAHSGQTVYRLLKATERALLQRVGSASSGTVWRDHYTFNVRAGKPVYLGAAGGAFTHADPHLCAAEGEDVLTSLRAGPAQMMVPLSVRGLAGSATAVGLRAFGTYAPGAGASKPTRRTKSKRKRAANAGASGGAGGTSSSGSVP